MSSSKLGFLLALGTRSLLRLPYLVEEGEKRRPALRTVIARPPGQWDEEHPDFQDWLARQTLPRSVPGQEAAWEPWEDVPAPGKAPRWGRRLLPPPPAATDLGLRGLCDGQVERIVAPFVLSPVVHSLLRWPVKRFSVTRSTVWVG
ncbi:hypothetical protein Agub_g11828 [Astrephomene gubernaculifera]|uniref:Uncharacterized protein n=1 Tax=Astrephomene gubernaculifera TaxID=47775 RepID=A0AAD3DX52_9CHLO|nr:hypothetical protein Agub_g11828 [Astrephomene gubernaculifera]